jgi:hypothetical protein
MQPDMGLTAVPTPAEESDYFALNRETGTTTQCETVDCVSGRDSAARILI